jgi:hypothetical protein
VTKPGEPRGGQPGPSQEDGYGPECLKVLKPMLEDAARIAAARALSGMLGHDADPRKVGVVEMAGRASLVWYRGRHYAFRVDEPRRAIPVDATELRREAARDRAGAAILDRMAEVLEGIDPDGMALAAPRAIMDAWARGDIPSERAMALLGCETHLEFLMACKSSGVFDDLPAWDDGEAAHNEQPEVSPK